VITGSPAFAGDDTRGDVAPFLNASAYRTFLASLESWRKQSAR
jgi:hypothetical protein